ncbi:YceI family protein [Acidicapsa dinghuensis]|uniref:YceI family protein n=1 Tax=Acidicapsa dinghuensis TaxID=2218256 RepID=A0ABW1EDB2_9BACT|nr:YceI family protein [Acidicapsa dinghuensis]
MKLVKVASAILALAAPLAIAQPSTWKSDSAHSDAEFVVKHLGISNVHGRLGKVNATITLDDTDITKSTVNAIIDVTGLDTGNSSRDNDVKGDNFFNVVKFPTATFVSTSVAKGGLGLLVTGNLTIKGVTKPVVLNVAGPSAPITGMDKKPHIGFEATTTLHRTDFDIAAKMPAAVVSDDVAITIDLDAAKQ